MINDAIKVSGKVQIQRLDANQKLIEQVEIPNIVVAAGKAFIASRMLNTSADVMSHMAVGSDATLQNTTDTALIAETGRVTLTSSANTTNTCLYVAQFAPGIATGEIREAGILNSVAGGTLLCRTTFPVVNKGVADTIIISWVITIS